MASLNPPSVCIDGRMLDARATGVGRYADTLLETLRLAGVNPLVLAPERGPRGWLWRWLRAPFTRPRTAPHEPDAGVLSGWIDLFREAQIFFDLHNRTMPVATDAPAGVMHWTYPVPLHLEGWRNIYTVHDVIPLGQPHLTLINGPRHFRLLKSISRSAARLLAVSEAAREQIIASLQCDAVHVTTILQGTPPLRAQSSLPAALRAGDYYLFCGLIEPRKNLLRLAQAHQASGVGRPLVIVGPLGWRGRELLRQILPARNILYLPYQTSEALGALIRDARSLLFPSLAEGFGLPVIEAMMAGTPVLASTIGALDEVAGGAALLVDPLDDRALAAAIARLDADESLIAALSAAGRERARLFSLPAYARRLVAFYAELMGAAV
jgi:glycosyltransferase involved in cell wall biosynthesis